MRLSILLLLCAAGFMFAEPLVWSQSIDDDAPSGQVRSKRRGAASNRAKAKRGQKKRRRRVRGGRRVRRDQDAKASRRRRPGKKKRRRSVRSDRPRSDRPPTSQTESVTTSIFRPSKFRKDGKAPLQETVPEVQPNQVRNLFVNAVITKPSPKPKLLTTSSGKVPPGRRASALIPGATSRWSNIGAIEPIESEVPLRAEMPVRNLPRPVGVVTTGQRLRGNETNVFSGRVSFSGTTLSVLNQPNYAPQEGTAPLEASNESRDVQLLRARVTGTYERIGGSQFSTQLDVEVRPRLNGDGRFDNQRLNAAYIGWGIQDLRPRREGDTNIGVSVGRLAVREAGFAQADGLLFRVRPSEGFDLGAFGGVTGNPYGFNWSQRIDESFSTNWVTGGAFGSLRGRQVQLSLAGVVTAATSPSASTTGGVERVYLNADFGWQPSRTVSIFASGYFDLLPSGQEIQNADLALAWSPRRFNFRVSAGRFSTVIYEGAIAGGGSVLDPVGPIFDPAQNPDQPIVDQNGLIVTPFDLAIQVASYYNFGVSGGYRLARSLEAYLRVNTRVRDTSQSEQVVASLIDDPQGIGLDGSAQFSPLRVTPAVGVRYQEPRIINVDGEAMFIQDDQAQTDMVLRFGLGRSLGGLSARADGRIFFGDIDGYDGGFQLSYSLPRSWSIGFLQFTASVRYYRENSVDLIDFGGANGIAPADALQILSNQETILGFAGLEWRR